MAYRVVVCWRASVQDGKAKLAPGLDSSKLEVALRDLAKFKIWDITNGLKLWPTFKEDSGWFTDPQKHTQFVFRIKNQPSVACCLEGGPGHVWYDLLWDVPHRDRFGREFGTWEVRRGEQREKATRLKALRQRALLGLEGAARQEGQEFAQTLEADGMSAMVAAA